jgi:hypothetical protein
MPTAEQCRVYAAEYQRLGQEADISIQRALGLWNWWEERVPKKWDLNANGNPDGKRPATRRDPYGIVAF